MNRYCLVCTLAVIFAPAAYGDTVLVMDDFEAYTSKENLYETWRPANGNSSVYWTSTDPAWLQAEVLGNSYNPNAFPTGGQGVGHLGGVDSVTNTAVLEWNGLSQANVLNPTASQNIVFGGDIYDSGPLTNNRRMSIALRSTAPANLVELGFWNANTCDPTVEGCTPGSATGTTPGFYPATQYASRVILFGNSQQAPLLVEPSWQYFQLPAELDRTTDTDEIVNKPDIGEGWHRYTATIGIDFVTLEIDLFRDNVRNDTRDENGVIVIGAGTPGVDASVTYSISATAAGFNSLRFGGPSGLSSLEAPGDNELIFDNIFLKLVDVVAPGLAGDYNDDGTVDAADYVIWRKNDGTGNALPNDGGLGTPIGSAHYDLWAANFGQMAAGSGGGSLGVVPEPATLTMLALGLAATAFRRRSR